MEIKTDTANDILANFGISKPSNTYDRWHRGDHFILDDFDEVLFESRYVLIIDWRAALKDELERIASLLPDFGVSINMDFNDTGNEAVLSCGDLSEKVKYCPSDNDDFEKVILALQRITPDLVEFRGSPLSEGADTWVFAMNGPEEWKEVDALAPEVMDHFFRKLSGSTESIHGRPWWRFW